VRHMRTMLLIVLSIHLSVAHATELSDLPTSDAIKLALSDFQASPTTYLEHYTEQPPELDFNGQDIGLVAKTQAHKNEATQIVLDTRKMQEAETAAVQSLRQEAPNLSEFEALNNALLEKYSDCKSAVNCALPGPSSDADFKEAIGDLAVLGEMSNQLPGSFNENSPILFQGRSMECKRYDIGFMNCCNSTGWGKFISQCSAQENELGQAREKEVAIFLGTRTSGHKPTRKKYDVFCVFESKLARLIQEGGRQHQLLVGFGNAKAPSCRGISANELSRIDFDAINLNEAYQDIARNISLPEQSILTNKITQSTASCANGSSDVHCADSQKEGSYA
jgi:hypothetical protein